MIIVLDSEPMLCEIIATAFKEYVTQVDVHVRKEFTNVITINGIKCKTRFNQYGLRNRLIKNKIVYEQYLRYRQ